MSPANSFRFRESRRLSRAAPVRLSGPGEGEELVARTRDIAIGGMFVATADVLPVGAAAAFVLELGAAEGPDTVRGEATVVWVREAQGVADQPAGMGMQFTRVEAPGEERLAMLFAEPPDEAAGSDAAGGTLSPAEAEESEPEAPTDPVDAAAQPPADRSAFPEESTTGDGGVGGPRPEPFADLADDRQTWMDRGSDRPAWVWPTVAGVILAGVLLVFLSGPLTRRVGVGGGNGAEEQSAVPSSEPTASSPEPAARTSSPAPPRSSPRQTESKFARLDPAPGAQRAGATAIRAISAAVRDGRTLVEITGNAPFKRHHVMPLEAPPRLLVRLIGVQRDYDAKTVSAPRLRGVRTGVHGRGATRNLHVVLDLAAPDILATVERSGDRVVVSLSD